MLGFYGSYQHTVDPKGRVSLPAQFRKKEGGFTKEIILVPSIEGNSLSLYTPEGFEEWSDKIFGEQGFQANDPEQVLWAEGFYGSVVPVELDNNGRINIPKELRDEFGLGDKVVFSGARDHIGLWNPEVWDQRMQNFNPRTIYKSPDKQ